MASGKAFVLNETHQSQRVDQEIARSLSDIKSGYNIALIPHCRDVPWHVSTG